MCVAVATCTFEKALSDAKGEFMQNIEYLNPSELPAYGYTNVVVVPGGLKTVYIGGQDAVNAKGEIVGIGDMEAQTRQTLHNMEIALAAGGAKPEHVIKWNVHIVQGHDFAPGFRAFQAWWGDRPNPPAVTAAVVVGLARPEFLVEIDAIAVVPDGQ